MWLTTSIEECVKNIILLSKIEKQDYFDNAFDLKCAFQRATPNSNSKFDGKVTFIKDKKKALSFRDRYNNDSVLDDLAQNSVINEDFSSSIQIINKVEDCYKSLCYKSECFKNIFNLTISNIFSLASDRARGGSSSELVGVIWANPRKHWNENDIHEFLIHELTHNLMYIDEARHGHYNNLITDKKTYCLSTILNIKRPLDKVVHSIVVGSEIVLAREEILGHDHHFHAHPPTELLINRIKNSINSIRNNSFAMNVLINNRVEFLLNSVEEKTSKICGIKMAI